jgi:hypothetical protein
MFYIPGMSEIMEFPDKKPQEQHPACPHAQSPRVNFMLPATDLTK